MKQSHLGWFLPFLILLFPALGCLGWEGLQQYRFTTQSDRLDAAIRAFQARAVLIGEEGRPLPLASGRAFPPYFNLMIDTSPGWKFHYRNWTLRAVFVDPKGLWHPLRMDIQIAQQRNLMLGSPEILVFWNNTPPPAFEAEFSAALQGFTYEVGRAHP